MDYSDSHYYSDYLDGGFPLAPGDVVVLENTRCNKGEKKDDEALAKKYVSVKK